MSRLDGLRSAAGSDRTRRIARVLGTVLIVVMAVPFAAYAFPSLAGAEKSFVVLSGSMEPTLSAGDVVFVYGADPASVEEGDVITYDRGAGRPVTHRVTAVTQTEDGDLAFRTKGDANEDADSDPVPAAALLGRVPTVSVPFAGEVTVHVPLMGRFIVLVNGSPILFLLGIAVLLGGDELWKRLSRRRHADASEQPATSGDGEPTESGTPTPENDAPAVRGTAAAQVTEPVDGADGRTASEGETMPVGAASGAADATAETGGDGTLTVSRVDLQLTAAVMAALLGFSSLAWLFSQQVPALAVAIASSLVLAGVGIVLSSGPGDGETQEAPDPIPETGVVEGSIAAVDLPAVFVDSREDLADRAADGGGWIVSEGDLRAYTDGTVLFAHADRLEGNGSGDVEDVPSPDGDPAGPASAANVGREVNDDND